MLALMSDAYEDTRPRWHAHVRVVRGHAPAVARPTTSAQAPRASLNRRLPLQPAGRTQCLADLGATEAHRLGQSPTEAELQAGTTLQGGTKQLSELASQVWGPQDVARG